MPIDYTLFMTFGLGGCLLAWFITRSVLFLTQTKTAPVAAPGRALAQAQQPVFLFDSDFLVDATGSAARLIAGKQRDLSDLDALIALLERQFPRIRTTLAELDEAEGTKVLTSEGLGLKIALRLSGGLTRIALGDPEDGDYSKFTDIERAAQIEELTLLRNLTENAPQLIWQEDSDGQLLWANTAYLEFGDKLAKEAEAARTVWPDARIFKDLLLPEPGELAQRRSRHSVTNPGQAGEYWFDITSVPQAGGVLHYAVDINETVRAELAKRAFQQTLSKTFAELSTGLAIFDKNRKLTMFNPALLDMTGLPIDFLSARPSIQMVLDRMREIQMLPEPKDYQSWRHQFLALEAAAETGNFSEIWDLPDGLTYRVTGRPHPDGALAFLFEDISAEVLLTRRFRTEIETSQSVLDSLPEAIAVFSGAGTLVMNNESYSRLWDIEDSDMLLGRDMRSAIRAWKSRCVPSEFWRELETQSRLAHQDRSALSHRITLTDGRHAMCHAQPLAGGMTMVKFVITAAALPSLAKTRKGDSVPRIVQG